MFLRDPSLEEEIRAIHEQFSRHVDALPEELKALTSATSLWKERGAGLGHYLPFWLNDELAKGTLISEARQMALSNHFGQIFCILRDGVVDGHSGTQPEIVILLDEFFFQFLHGYQNLFPASHRFWNYFKDYWREYLQAMAYEKIHHHGHVAPYGNEDFLWMGRKLSPVKICCAGMALLAGKEDQIPLLSQMVEHLQVGYQLQDDLKDWPEDMERGDYTYPFTLVSLQRPQDKEGFPPRREEIERILWSEGLAFEVLEESIHFLFQSLQDISCLPLPRLKTWIQEMMIQTRLKMGAMSDLQVKKVDRPQLKIFSEDGHALVFNVSTSVLYDLDQEAASFLTRMEDGLWQTDASRSEEVFEELKVAGVFSSLAPPKREENLPLTTLYLNVSSRCNLRCQYCFAEGGKYQGERGQMSLEVGERAVDLLVRESKDSPNVKVVFFGGEPMLNRQVVTRVIQYGRRESARQGKQMRFLLVTNGTLMDPEMIDLLSRERVSVHISLDGPPEVHNRQRPTRGGGRTYDQVISNIRSLQKGGVERLGIRTTLFNLDSPPVDILDHLWSLGVGPVQMEFVQPTHDCKSPWSETDLRAVEEIQKGLADYFFKQLQEGRFVAYANILQPLIRLYRRNRFPSHCSAGITMGAVTPEGTLFPCFRFSEKMDSAIGSVWDGLHREKMASFVRYTVDQSEPCRNCWARYLCGGGCLYNNLLVNGDIGRPDPFHCSRIKDQFRLVIQLFAKIKRQLPELVTRIEQNSEDLFSFTPQSQERCQ